MYSTALRRIPKRRRDRPAHPPRRVYAVRRKLAEHGVGRNAVKQELLRMTYGREGIEAMRRIKQAIDPEWKLSPGVLFPEVRSEK